MGTNGLTRRKFLRAAGLGGGALAASRFIGGNALAQRPKVNLGYLQLGWAATEIIHVEDLMGKRGWDATYMPIAGPPIDLITAYAARKLDASDMSFWLVANMWERGIPVKITGVATALLGAIVVPKGSPIKDVEELKGKKVAAVIGTTTYMDTRALVKMGWGFDLEKEARIISAKGPPDLVTLVDKGEVEAMVGWQPMSDQLVLRGHRYLVKQIDLWRKATKRTGDYPVHVVYIAHPEFIKEHPKFPADLNDAQREAVDIWYKDKPRALKAVIQITKLKPEEAEFAHSQTVRMLSGLTDDQVDTLLLQLKVAKETGFLKSTFWDDPDRVKRELFWRG